MPTLGARRVRSPCNCSRACYRKSCNRRMRATVTGTLKTPGTASFATRNVVSSVQVRHRWLQQQKSVAFPGYVSTATAWCSSATADTSNVFRLRPRGARAISLSRSPVTRKRLTAYCAISACRYRSRFSYAARARRSGQPSELAIPWCSNPCPPITAAVCQSTSRQPRKSRSRLIKRGSTIAP